MEEVKNPVIVEKPCEFCGKKMEGTVRRKFCGTTCRTNSHRKYKRMLKEKNMKISAMRQVPEHVQDMIQLAFGADTQDVIREVLREEIRENITQAVHDNVLGAAEILTQALPKALAGVIRDLDNQDYYVRGRAQQLVFKYAMPLGDLEGKDKDLGTITVSHGVAIPNTNLGAATVDEIAEGEAYVEAFEKDWPICESCDIRKHPDTMYIRPRPDGVIRYLCKTCQIRRNLDIKAREESGATN